jgi:thiazole synthase ThiGH ThiG subunit
MAVAVFCGVAVALGATGVLVAVAVATGRPGVLVAVAVAVAVAVGVMGLLLPGMQST